MAGRDARSTASAPPRARWRCRSAAAGSPGASARFVPLAETRLFAEDGREIPKGSDEPGLIAAGGAALPAGYYKDPEKTAKTFRVVDGKRYAFIGDWGQWNADGTLQLLGRGSACINTGGEKVYPEEVEHVHRRATRTSPTAS